MPGDRIEVRDDHLIINGETIAQVDQGAYADGCYVGLRLTTETLGAHTHQVMSCHSPYGLLGARGFISGGNPNPLPACDRRKIVERDGGYVCDASVGKGARDAHDFTFDVVPPGHYVMIGDNRDNSEDSRAWGLVPDQNLVGKATRIWFNFDLQRSRVVNWSRIGQGIE
jgi:signal peptidase I